MSEQELETRLSREAAKRLLTFSVKEHAVATAREIARQYGIEPEKLEAVALFWAFEALSAGAKELLRRYNDQRPEVD